MKYEISFREWELNFISELQAGHIFIFITSMFS